VVSLTDSTGREPEDRPPPGAPGHVTSIEDTEETRLNRVITRPMLTFFILGDILGSGIYALTGEVAADVGGAIWASFIVAFALAFVTAFAYLELVTKYPRAAGAALYVHRAFAISILSFLVTIAVMASGVTSASFSATRIGGRYFEGLFGVESPPTILIAIFVICLVAVVNYWGVGESIRINIGISLIEITGLLFIIAIGVYVLFSGDGNPGQAFEFKDSGLGALNGIVAGAATGFYAFIGFEDSVNMAEEVKDPVRTFPPALVGGIVAASIIYLLVGFTAAMVVPLDVLTESSGPLLEIVRIGVPDLNVDTLFSAIAMIAVSNTMLINMLMASRLLYGMANQGVLPAAFGLVSSSRRTPWFSIIFTTALSIVLILLVDDFANLADTTVLLLTGVFLLVNICVLVLRRDPVAHDHFVAPSILPIIGAIVSAVFLLPLDRDSYIYLLAIYLLIGGLVLWGINYAVTRRTGTVVEEADLTREDRSDRP
jgi:APA family basic amino acid/polyamine antiporter